MQSKKELPAAAPKQIKKKSLKPHQMKTGVLVQPGQTWASLPHAERLAHLRAHENKWRTKNNQNSIGKESFTQG